MERSRNQNGEFRRKKSNTKIESLKTRYPVLDCINGNMHLGTLLDRLEVDSLSKALKTLRKQ